MKNKMKVNNKVHTRNTREKFRFVFVVRKIKQWILNSFLNSFARNENSKNRKTIKKK